MSKTESRFGWLRLPAARASRSSRSLVARPLVGGQDLDCHLAAQARVPRPIHLTHPPRPEGTDHFVRTQARPGWERDRGPPASAGFYLRSTVRSADTWTLWKAQALAATFTTSARTWWRPPPGAALDLGVPLRGSRPPPRRWSRRGSGGPGRGNRRSPGICPRSRDVKTFPSKAALIPSRPRCMTPSGSCSSAASCPPRGRPGSPPLRTRSAEGVEELLDRRKAGRHRARPPSPRTAPGAWGDDSPPRRTGQRPRAGARRTRFSSCALLGCAAGRPRRRRSCIGRRRS